MGCFFSEGRGFPARPPPGLTGAAAPALGIILAGSRCPHCQGAGALFAASPKRDAETFAELLEPSLAT